LIKKQISVLNTEISNTSKELLAKQQELEAKKAEIQETDDLFKERLRAMYVMRSNGTLSAILGAEDMSQFMTTADAIQRISVRDTELLKQMEIEKALIIEQEAAIQEELSKLEEKQNTLNTKQTELAYTMRVLNNNLTDIEAEQKAAEETQSEVYAEYLAAKEAMEKEFANSNGSFVGGEWLWPVPTNGFISSGFGWRTLYGRADNHIGIDIATGWGQGWPAINNQKIVASNSGTVTKAFYGTTGYGNYVIIDHGGNNFTLYGHCSSLAVRVGQKVTQGQTIAYVGSTGNSTGPHLHFEIRLNGKPVNPAPLIESSRPRR
jgi:murein DD-endopeptidase MepM/ murein hydrolase activator NlpD